MTIIILFALCRSLSGVNPGEVVPYHGHLVTSQMNSVICFNIIVINELQFVSRHRVIILDHITFIANKCFNALYVIIFIV